MWHTAVQSKAEKQLHPLKYKAKKIPARGERLMACAVQKYGGRSYAMDIAYGIPQRDGAVVGHAAPHVL
jgi:hypothetical protein